MIMKCWQVLGKALPTDSQVAGRPANMQKDRQTDRQRERRDK